MEGGIQPIKKPDGTPFKFLVTDDSQFMRKQVVRIVQQIGGEVAAEAENGEQAVEMYQTHQPDLVTMDITMPILNGVEALRKIIEIDKNALVVMVTAIGHETIVKQAIMLGSKHFVVKPFKPTDVSQTLIAILKKYAGGVQ
ncbi:MAG TPA: response regulator [bacterium]|nr:response regulator [bacterium]